MLFRRVLLLAAVVQYSDLTLALLDNCPSPPPAHSINPKARPKCQINTKLEFFFGQDSILLGSGTASQ